MDAPRRPREAIGRDAPDLVLSDHDAHTFPLRSRVGAGPLALFFYIHNGTPG